MAAPIAHIFLGLQLLSHAQGLFDEKEFIRGTSFPDIRYLKCIERCETHAENVSLADVKIERDSFKAGMLFHSFVDEQREKYMESIGIYQKLPQFKFIGQALKFAEDKILSELVDARNYSTYFDDMILSQEKAIVSLEEAIGRWHMFLKKYFFGVFSTYQLMMNYFDLHEPNAWKVKRWLFALLYARKIDTIVKTIVNDPELKNSIMEFYQSFPYKSCAA